MVNDEATIVMNDKATMVMNDEIKQFITSALN